MAAGEDPKAYFLSDLHLFARRSSATAMDAAIIRAVQQAHTFILGGDIFDFRWSEFPSLDKSVEASMRWLDRLISINPNCRFHYLLGNHDAHPKFVSALDQFSEQEPRLQWHRHVLRINHCVFLHGDIVDTRIKLGQDHHEVLDAKRLAGEERRPPRQISHNLYDAVVKVGLHRVATQVAQRQNSVLRRVAGYLANIGLGTETGVREVYFGHIHRVLDNIPYAGMNFHNPGASIKGLDFRIIEPRLAQSSK